MKRLLFSGAAASAMLTLSACGGGGVASTPAPPTATPTPTPPPTYTKIDDLAGDQTFQSATLTFAADQGTGPNGHITRNFGSGSVIAYDAANDSYTITSPGGRAETFLPSDIDLVNSTANSTRWDKTINGTRSIAVLIVPTSTTGIELTYTRFGSWNQIITSSGSQLVEYFIAGVPTLASDVPTTGTANYNAGFGGIAISGNKVYNLSTSDSSMDFAVNFVTGGITTALNFMGAEAGTNSITNLGTANGTGLITADGPGFAGTFNGGIATGGAFSGAFFGPRAAEFGLTYLVTGDQFLAQGLAAGIKTELLP